jgi:hypothetical protein
MENRSCMEVGTSDGVDIRKGVGGYKCGGNITYSCMKMEK